MGSENLTSGRWPRWVARYEKGGWAVQSGLIYEKWGGAIRFRSITKRGGGQFASGPLRKVGRGGGGGGGNSLQVQYEKWGGSDVSSPIGVWRSPRSFASRDPHHISGP